jgi:hypothetical protein
MRIYHETARAAKSSRCGLVRADIRHHPAFRVISDDAHMRETTRSAETGSYRRASRMINIDDAPDSI